MIKKFKKEKAIKKNNKNFTNKYSKAVSLKNMF